MTTIGDVFGIVAGLFGACISMWAMLLSMALLFERRVAHARTTLEHSPWKAFAIGITIGLVVTVIGLTMVAAPLPALKLAGWATLMFVLAVAALGAGGLAKLVGDRAQPLDPNQSHFKSISRGAAILVIAGLVPFLGWFAFAPVALIFSFGAGLSAMLHRERIVSVPAESRAQ